MKCYKSIGRNNIWSNYFVVHSPSTIYHYWSSDRRCWVRGTYNSWEDRVKTAGFIAENLAETSRLALLIICGSIPKETDG